MDRYRETALAGSQKWPMVKLGDVLVIERGASPRPIQDFITNDPNGINWIKIGDTSRGPKYIYSTEEKITPEGAEKSRRVKEGDFLLSNSMSFGRPYILKTSGCIHDGWLLLRPKNGEICQDFLYYILGSQGVLSQFETSATGGVVRNLNSALVRNVSIPLPPLAVQEALVAELERYRKMIEGARAIIQNYKPEIEIDPKWEMRELGEVCDFKSGGTPSKANSSYWSGDIPWISPKDMKSYEIGDSEDHISEESLRSSAARLVPAATILCVTRSGILVHSFPVGITTRDVSFNQDIVALIPDKSVLLSRYLFYLLKTLESKVLTEGVKKGGTVQSLHSGFLQRLKIPIPPLPEQQAVVARLEAERAEIEMLKGLIARTEEKIKSRVAALWQ